MMKKSDIKWLIHHLKNEVDDTHFDMGSWLRHIYSPDKYDKCDNPLENFHCKTAGCLAGHIFMSIPVERRMDFIRDGQMLRQERGHSPISIPCWVGDGAMAALGCSFEEAHMMFIPAVHGLMSSVPRHQVIRMLEYMLEHNQINWFRATNSDKFLTGSLDVVFAP